MIVSWFVRPRDAGSAFTFASDLKSRLANPRATHVGRLKLYVDAVEDVFGSDVDYAQLVKRHGASGENETRYSPAKCIGCLAKEVTGNPDPKHISTSYVERQTLTMRMHMRRFTRLTNGFSKKRENHVHMIALYDERCPPSTPTARQPDPEQAVGRGEVHAPSARAFQHQ